MFARSFLFIVLPSPPARLSSFSFSVGAVSADRLLVGCSSLMLMSVVGLSLGLSVISIKICDHYVRCK